MSTVAVLACLLAVEIGLLDAQAGSQRMCENTETLGTGCRRVDWRSSRVSSDSNISESEVARSSFFGANLCAVRRLWGTSRTCRTGTEDKPDCILESLYETRYCCCPGYSTIMGQSGCPKDNKSKSLLAFLETNQMGRFIELFQKAGLTDYLLGETSMTLFVPRESSLEVLEELQDRPEMLIRALGDHLVPGRLLLNAFVHDLSLSTMSEGSVLWVSRPAASCQVFVQNSKIVSHDHLTGNGVIHVIEKPLTAATTGVLKRLGELQDFSVMAKAWEATSMELTKPSTVFAPTDQAFLAVPEKRLASIIQKDACLKNLLHNHVTESLVYSSMLPPSSWSAVKTKAGFSVKLTKRVQKIMFGDAINVTRTDMPVREGVLHSVDAVNIPESALTILLALEESGASSFVHLFEKLGLEQEITADGKFTVFAPSSSALGEISSVMSDDEMELVLRFHVVPGLHPRKSFRNGQILDTLAPGRKLRVSKLGSTVAVQGVRLPSQCDREVCQGIIHVIDEVLEMYLPSIDSYVSSHPNLTTFYKVLKQGDLSSFTRSKGVFSWTLFAPTDDALRSPLGLPLIDQHPASFLRCHVVEDSYPIGLLNKVTRYTLQTLCGTTARVVHHRASGWLIDTHTRILSSSYLDDGVVHIIDGPLQVGYPRRSAAAIQRMRACRRCPKAATAALNRNISMLSVYDE